MPSGYRMRVEWQVLADRRAAFDAAIPGILEEATREAAREFLATAEDRVAAQRIPGPPLTPTTVEIEERLLRARGLPVDRARMKWILFDQAVARPQVVTATEGRGARGWIVPPEGRSMGLYRKLELGGFAPNGRPVMPRPLWTTVAAQDAERWFGAFRRTVKDRVDRTTG